MAQLCTVIQADPQALATALTALAGTIEIVEKTTSAGKFLVVYDSAPSSQAIVVITGDPESLAASLNTIISGGDLIELIIPTFSASHYVVVSQ
jgi:nitrate reductase NapAB chaperone NapD